MAEPRELEAAEGLLALAGSGALAPAAGVAYEVGCSSVTRAMHLEVLARHACWQQVFASVLFPAGITGLCDSQS